MADKAVRPSDIVTMIRGDRSMGSDALFKIGVNDGDVWVTK
jgi:hypothetical protein